MVWWMAWPTAARDHETFCVACHTAVPYAMARPALRAALAESAPSAIERKLLENVTKRVRLWNDVQPFYPDKKDDPKTAESRGTESILNALILAGYDAQTGKLSPDTRLALGNMWAQQLKAGESKGASTKVPGLLTAAQQKSIIDEALGKQQADGGFSLSSFVGTWKRRDNTPLETKSDGYATGVVAFVLQQAGMRRDQQQLNRSLAWLGSNQDKSEGRWLAYSLNKQRDLSSDAGRFMSDAATAFAVLALKPGK